MQTTLELPRDYIPTGGIDLVNDKSARTKVYALALVTLVGLFLLGNYFVPLTVIFFDATGEPATLPAIAVKLGVIVVLILFYVIIHEKIHGAFMAKYSGVKAAFGFTGSMAWCGSPAYFSRQDFRVIALAPVVSLTAIITVVTLLLPVDWFWVGFAAQLMNLSGSMGDIYSIWKLRRLDADGLIHDNGLVQTWYTPDPDFLENRPGTVRSDRAVRRQSQRINRKTRKK